jgi:hypothetical protein
MLVFTPFGRWIPVLCPEALYVNLVFVPPGYVISVWRFIRS